MRKSLEIYKERFIKSAIYELITSFEFLCDLDFDIVPIRIEIFREVFDRKKFRIKFLYLERMDIKPNCRTNEEDFATFPIYHDFSSNFGFPEELTVVSESVEDVLYTALELINKEHKKAHQITD